MYTIQGTLHVVGPTQQAQHNAKLSSRMIVITTEVNGRTQYLKLILFNDRCKQVDNLPVGEVVSVVFRICGKEKEVDDGKKIFVNTIEAVSVVPLTAGALINMNTTPAREKRPRIRREKTNYEFKRNSEKQ